LLISVFLLLDLHRTPLYDLAFYFKLARFVQGSNLPVWADLSIDRPARFTRSNKAASGSLAKKRLKWKKGWRWHWYSVFFGSS
jgi:hypothetical protein